MNKEIKDYYSVERWGLFKVKDRWCYLPTSEDCLGVNKTILEMLSLYKTELGALKKALIQASKLKTRSGSFKTYSCPQFVAKCFANQHINIFPHYIRVSMSFATVSSTQPVTKVLNTPSLLVGCPRCAKSQMLAPDVLQFSPHISASAKRLSAADSFLTRNNTDRV